MGVWDGDGVKRGSEMGRAGGRSRREGGAGIPMDDSLCRTAETNTL